MSDDTITLAGGGLAGSLLAVFLARRGLRVTVYERRPDLRRHDVSAGKSINLALADRGIAALKAVGLFESVRPILVPMPGRLLHAPDGALSYLPYGSRPHEVNWSVSRGDLNKALLDAAEATGRVTVFFDHRVVDADLDAGTLTVLDETTGAQRVVPANPVIATDGAGSAVREAMRRRFGVEVSDEPLAHAYKELTIPPAELGGWAMRHDALHIWPRGTYMLIALPNPDQSFTVTLFMPREGFDALTTPPAVTEFFSAHFADAVPLMPGLVEDFFKNPTGSLGTVRCRPWTGGLGRAVLLGDAAHAIVPFHGQGMNAAFEDCVVLDRALATYGSDYKAAFDAFAAERKPDAEAIADMALENYVEMRDTVRDPKFALKKSVGFALEARHPRRFIPRYSMVMFHAEIPYSEARRRGAVQAEILDALTREVDTAEQVDYALADRMVTERLTVLPHVEG